MSDQNGHKDGNDLGKPAPKSKPEVAEYANAPERKQKEGESKKSSPQFGNEKN